MGGTNISVVTIQISLPFFASRLMYVFTCKPERQYNMTAPWKEWIPGALNDFQLRELITQGFIEHAEDCKPDYSSFDLRLGNEGYKMLKGSIKPQGGGYGQFLSSNSAFAAPLSFDNNTVILAPKNTYVFKLKEKLAMKLDTSKIHGQATAKSSVGRVDVLARLI